MGKLKELIAVEKGLKPDGTTTDNPALPMLVRAAFSDSPAMDAFGRLRVSNPTTLFENRQHYGDQALFWENSTSGTGTVTSQTNRSSVYVRTGGSTVGAKAVRQSRYNFLYQAGRSMAAFLTFVLGARTANVRKRVGFFNEPRAGHGDGIILEQDGSNEYLILRSSLTGTASDAVKFARADWVDKMDGTGPSGINIDFTKSQIFLPDLQFLGVGRVRCGFDIDGVFYPCHEFKNANNIVGAYMRTADLNIRYEIENTGAGSDVYIEQICSAVMSEGGATPGSIGVPRTAMTALGGVGVTTRRPILTLRAKTAMNSVRNRGHIFPEELGLLVGTNPAIIELVLNGTVSGGAGAWTDVGATNSLAEYNLDHTSISGGTIIRTIPAASAAGAAREPLREVIGTQFPLVYTDLLSAQDTLSVVATAQTGTSNVFAAVNWREYF